MARPLTLGAAVVLLVAGCAHDSSGRRVRSGDIRFDERSITGPNVELTLVPDGTWSNWYVQQGDEIRAGDPVVLVQLGAGRDDPLLKNVPVAHDLFKNQPTADRRPRHVRGDELRQLLLGGATHEGRHSKGEAGSEG